MKYLNFFSFLFILFVLSGCSMSISSIIDALNYSKTGADVLSYAATEKTTTDHTLSYVFKKDCSLARTLKLKAICNEINKETNSFNNIKKNYQIKKKIIHKKITKKKRIIVPSMAY